MTFRPPPPLMCQSERRREIFPFPPPPLPQPHTASSHVWIGGAADGGGDGATDCHMAAQRYNANPVADIFTLRTHVSFRVAKGDGYINRRENVVFTERGPSDTRMPTRTKTAARGSTCAH